MRSERKMVRSLLARFMVLMMVINLLGGINPSAVKAGPDEYYKNGSEKQENGVTISKKVTRYNAADGTYDIELKVKGSTEVVQNNKILDIVLVMDTSGSMEGKSLENAKKAANNFVDKLLPQNNNVNIGIVSFAEKGEIKSGLTRNVTTLKNAIKGLKADGGTYTQQGLEKAATVLNGAPAEHKKVMVVIGDGEPTYANGEHPNFDKGGFYRIYNPATKKEGYEQWYGNAFKWLGKGYNSAHRNYLVKLINGGFGNGTKERKGWGHVSWPFNLMDDYFENATLKAADTIKNNTEIITVGIDIENNDLAKSIMNKLATSGKYLKAGAVAGELDKILDDIAEKLQKKVSEGVITDNMSEYVNCLVNSVKLSGKSENLSPEISDKSITVRNINLGKDEELIISYKVKLKDNWKDGEFHKANGKTTLLPTKNGQEMDFNVPEIRSDRATTSIVVNKKWVGNKVPDGLNELTLEVIPKTSENYSITVKKDDNWTGKLENLPKYKNGSKIEYNVAEPAGNNYEKIGEITKTESSDGVLTFKVTNKSTEKTSFTVKKDWASTPEELKFDVNVQLYADGKKIDGKTATISNGNTEVTFAGLDKYSPVGNKINYTAKEVGEEGGKLTYGNFNFEVKYETVNGIYKITNKCSNPGNATFAVTLTKIWEGWKGESAKEAKFNFRDGKGNVIPVTLDTNNNVPTQETDKTTWKKTIKLPKYYFDGTEASYNVTEENNNAGFTSDKPNGAPVDANNTNPTFTNKRVLQKITVTKDWGVTPDEFIKEINAVLSGKAGTYEVTETKAINKGGTTAEFEVPTTTPDGAPIEYAAIEEGVNNAGIISIGGKEFKVTYPWKYKIVNTYTGLENDTIKLTIKKKWVGDGRTNAEFEVKDETGNKAANNIILNNDPWSTTIELPKWDKVTGQLKKYTVNEVNLSKAFTSSSESKTENDKIEVTFTNTRIKRWLEVEKKWFGNPAVVANSLANFKLEYLGVNSRQFSLPNNDGSLIQKFNLPVYDLNGNPIEYKISETPVEGFAADATAHTVKLSELLQGETLAIPKKITFTNTELIDITVKKVWDANVPMPEQKSVEAAIFNGATEVDSVKLNEGNGWQHTFTNLPYLENGYTVKETAVNGAEVNDDLKKLYDIVVDKENIKETTTVTIKNSFKLTVPAEDKIKVVKQWMVNPGNKEVTVKVFKKTIGTPAEPSKWVETSDFKKLRGGYVLETDFNKPAAAEDYYVLETAIGGTELTEDEIQNILNSNNLETVQYKIGEYDVLVKEPEDRTFFIKNSNDKKLTELNVEKQWSAHTLARYVQPVKVQLYAETGGVLEAVGSPVELNSAKWKTRFKGLDKYDNNGKEIKYHVAEVAVADEMKNDVTLSDIQNGYKIGKYDVAVDGDGTENIVIRNDVNLVDITARKDWGTVSESNRKPVEFTLYKREGAELKEVTGRTLTGAGGNWTVEFKDQPRADENGEEFTYYVFETKIDGTAVGIDPLAGVGYTVDPITQTILYTTGTINNGKYSVEISVNAVNNKEIVVKNSFTANNSGGIIVPPIPGFDPNPPAPGNNTPAVDVPDDTTPQGNANTDKTNTEADNTGADNADDDGVVEIDEDDTPEGKAKDGADNSSPQGTTDIGEDETPQGRAALPKTGGTAGDFFGIIGLGLIGLGLVFKKRKN
ncbi:LPXTG-motif protein cell wall anchor domain protein [Catonella morbi ATCC 51271]|uniref:LPXTG-motif protein cell wall anchor domain protein n=1 Tax=Catonella morbi ATCC 51271 TaxID=592026 RepID=V2ZAI2_9FIRM|nr:Cna B-type domain-containing protein [Catonella morbi]ESL03945.1 LPXTG-motif protein cell wall anchor domain protein [Catonella morbi ATCC 51271]